MILGFVIVCYVAITSARPQCLRPFSVSPSKSPELGAGPMMMSALILVLCLLFSYTYALLVRLSGWVSSNDHAEKISGRRMQS